MADQPGVPGPCAAGLPKVSNAAPAAACWGLSAFEGVPARIAASTPRRTRRPRRDVESGIAPPFRSAQRGARDRIEWRTDCTLALCSEACVESVHLTSEDGYTARPTPDDGRQAAGRRVAHIPGTVRGSEHRHVGL